MTPPDRSVPASYFDALYERDPDPWRFASSRYEREKYATTLAAIGDTTVDRGWEVGCSIGVFTKALASRCAALLAVDVAEAALEQARARCADCPWVCFRRLRVPRQWPSGQFDLIVFSEVLYFLSAADVRRTARRALAGLAPHGRIVLVNWTGETGQSLSGTEAAGLFHDVVETTTRRLCHTSRSGYRLDVYRALS